jgi:hypothetical protein
VAALVRELRPRGRVLIVGPDYEAGCQLTTVFKVRRWGRGKTRRIAILSGADDDNCRKVLHGFRARTAMTRGRSEIFVFAGLAPANRPLDGRLSAWARSHTCGDYPAITHPQRCCGQRRDSIFLAQLGGKRKGPARRP